MFTTKWIFILIIAVCVVFFLVAVFSILKKKGKKDKKKKKSNPEPGKEPEIKPEKLQKKEPKINKKKLEEMAKNEATVAPVFSKDELEAERQKELSEQLEKSKASNPRQNTIPFPGFGAGIPFPTNIQGKPKPLKINPTPQKPVVQPMVSTENYVEVKQEDKDFVEALKKKGIIDKKASFGESLIIKEAIETPASKKEMKQKRQKWI